MGWIWLVRVSMWLWAARQQAVQTWVLRRAGCRWRVQRGGAEELLEEEVLYAQAADSLAGSR